MPKPLGWPEAAIIADKSIIGGHRTIACLFVPPDEARRGAARSIDLEP